MEILAERTVEVIGYSNFVENCLFITLALIFISLAIFALCVHGDSNASEVIGVISFFMTVFFIMALIGFSIFGSSPQTQYQEYKVLFDENVNLNDFSDKYEIVSREGDIFTIRDIEEVPIQN